MPGKLLRALLKDVSKVVILIGVQLSTSSNVSFLTDEMSFPNCMIQIYIIMNVRKEMQILYRWSTEKG